MQHDRPTDFRETLYTIDRKGRRHWVYNALVKGRFLTRRRIVVGLLMAFYLTMPWISVGGTQAIFLDIPARRFTFFGNVFFATDTIFLVMVLAGLALSLFFFTASFGRVWCGWACPETVFLDFVFRPVERLIEGGPAERMRLDQSPWTAHKIVVKVGKFTVFAIICWFLASTFLAYFVGREPLIAMMQQSPALHVGPFLFTVAVAGAMLFQFGWFREQFCTVLCPYARFQSVLMDADSLTVGYDVKRGEPRGKLQKSDQNKTTHGDCIDCGLCVRVCPTGIDIRNGLQLECISCAACVDACDSIMTKIGKPLGLVRYDTERQLAGGTSKFLRPRLFVYATALLVLFSVFSYRITHRAPIELQMLRGANNVPFTILPDGRASNPLHVHALNKTDRPRNIQFEVVNPAQDVEMIIPVNPFPLAPQAHTEIPVFINVIPRLLKDGKMKVTVRYTDLISGFSAEETVSVFGLNSDGMSRNADEIVR